jgi:predicted transcriptional regulator
MTISSEPLGPLEFDVLRYVSDHAPVSVREVADHFAKTTGQARTTVLTVMDRLRTKGYLTRRKVNGVHRYAPTTPKAELLQRMVGNFVHDVLGGAVSPFVAWMTQSSDLSESEIRKLTKILEKMKRREQERET